MHDAAHLAHLQHDAGWTQDAIALALCAAALALYAALAARSSRRYGRWPPVRSACWLAGIACVAASVAGPLAAQARVDFGAHMVGHVLLGMLGPLLLALAAPLTLALRSLSVKSARRLTRLLRRRPFAVLTDPAVAALLNVGGLWVLYMTEVHALMHRIPLVHWVVHAHVLLAGYLFTISMITVDPAPHRRSFMYRAVVLTAALAAHDILAKVVYARPPAGVAPAAAESGGMIMYYGGDAVDLALIIILFGQWRRASARRGGAGRMRPALLARDAHLQPQSREQQPDRRQPSLDRSGSRRDVQRQSGRLAAEPERFAQAPDERRTQDGAERRPLP